MTLVIDPIHFHAEASPDLLGQVGEKNARTITVVQPAIPGAVNYALLFQIPDAASTAESSAATDASHAAATLFSVTCTSGSVTVPNAILQRSGTVWCQWVARDQAGSKIAKSNLIPLRVEPSLSAVEGTIPTPEELQTKYDTMMQELEKAKTSMLEAIRSAGGSPTAVSQVLEYTELSNGIYSFTPAHNRLYRFCVTDSESDPPHPPLLQVLAPDVSGTNAVFHCQILLQHFSAFQISFADNLTGTDGLSVSNGFFFVDSSHAQDLIALSLWYDGFGFRYHWAAI